MSTAQVARHTLHRITLAAFQKTLQAGEGTRAMASQIRNQAILGTADLKKPWNWDREVTEVLEQAWRRGYEAGLEERER